MVGSAWTTNAYSYNVWLENTQDKGKIELYMCVCESVVSDSNEPRRKCAFIRVNGRGRSSYNSGHSKTNKACSVLIRLTANLPVRASMRKGVHLYVHLLRPAQSPVH